MEIFVWDSEFYTGIDKIDAEHHGLVNLFNELGNALEKKGASSDKELTDVYQRLLDYTKHHFSNERLMMQKWAIDERHVSRHLAAHRDFVEKLKALWEAREAVQNPAEVFLSYLTSWLCLHVLGLDQNLARQIESIRAGESTSRAFELQEKMSDKSAEAMIKALRNVYHVMSRMSTDLIAANHLLEERVSQRTEELRRANQALIDANYKLEIYSHTDGMLGIANRAYFDIRLGEEWRRAARDDQPLSLLMIDVDFFKLYNDTYGHQAGDDCLRAVAQAAESCLERATDLLSRYGGEEFVILLPNTTQEGARKVAEGICAAVAARNISHAASSVAAHVTVSIGMASILPDRMASAEKLVSVADAALYEAKRAGRNRISPA